MPEPILELLDDIEMAARQPTVSMRIGTASARESGPSLDKLHRRSGAGAWFLHAGSRVRAHHALRFLEPLGSITSFSASLAVLMPAACVAVLWIEAVVHLAMEIHRAIKLRTNADKGPAVEPLRAIVSIWSAAVGVVVTVGA